MTLKKIKLFVCLSFLFLMSYSVNAQISVGSSSPNPSSQLDIVSTSKGVLIPRVRLFGLNDKITIQNGNVESLLVYNLSITNDLSSGYYYWSGTIWNRIITDKGLKEFYELKWDKRGKHC